jgi:ABC-type multidrug transport system permease subunit
MLLAQTRFACVSALRNPRNVFLAIVFPIFLLVLFNSIFAHGSNAYTRIAGARIPTKAYFTAGLAAYAIALQTFTQTVVSITTERESGQLKRLRGTPMPAWCFVLSHLLRAFLLVAAVTLALFVIGGVAFHVHFHANGVAGIVVYVAVGSTTMAALGMAMTILMPTVDTASMVGAFAIVILSFVSGIFLPPQDLPGWLRSLGSIFPLQHLSDGLQRTLIPTSGTGLTASNLFPLVVWLAVGAIFAARRFRWEPQHR